MTKNEAEEYVERIFKYAGIPDDIIEIAILFAMNDDFKEVMRLFVEHSNDYDIIA